VRPLSEQIILVTGSTDGHGRRVAEELVKLDATVLVHGRNPEKVERVTSEIGASRGLTADLSRLGEVRALAGEIDQLDTLVNNAGIVMPERQESPDGYELTFAVNYLSHFLLTALLLPKLREPARIVNVSSIGQYPLDLDDLQYERDFNGYYAYAKSKLAQILFTYELAERLGERDLTVNALHPATLMDTPMVLGPGGTPQSSVEEGVAATLRLITDPSLDGVTGSFFNGKRDWRPDEQANDPQARRRLWDESERLAGLK
jgi:NAD(P)-dependent dehydrogenase (short-subunit alcohol dehydrogenase family)